MHLQLRNHCVGDSATISNGFVDEIINVDNNGNNYTSIPQVKIDDPINIQKLSIPFKQIYIVI